MDVNVILASAAALLSATLALTVAMRSRRSISRWSFCAGMLLFSIESILTALSFHQSSADSAAFWQNLAFFVKSFLPGVWLLFSLTYSRANYREFLGRSRLLLVAFFLFPLCWVGSLHAPFFEITTYEPPLEGWAFRFSDTAKILNAAILISMVLILMNLERTFRSAVGTMRWRIKFLVLGLAVIFGSRIYSGTQSLLFSGYSLAELNVKSIALLIGCSLIAASYFRSGFGEVDLYPSRAVLHTSVTVLLAGAYLFVVGVLAQVVARFGGAASFPMATFLVLLGIAGLALLLLSERLRQRIQLFVSRHFKRPQHDFQQIWARLAAASSGLLEEKSLSATSAGFISDTFGALSVSVWLLDPQCNRLVRAGSTSYLREGSDLRNSIAADDGSLAKLGNLSRPFNPKKTKGIWPKSLSEITGGQFRTGGDPVVVPLLAGGQWLGVIILADRVQGISYTAEEMDLLKCIGDQIAANLLNLRLTRELMEKNELEAFQTIAAFFVHDLKNAASTLGLMLQNLPIHFDDPAFRQDAFRGIASTAGRINELVERLNTFRHELRLDRAELDLNSLVDEALANLNGSMVGDSSKISARCRRSREIVLSFKA